MCCASTYKLTRDNPLGKIPSDNDGQCNFKHNEHHQAIFSRPERKINNRNRIKNIILYIRQSLAKIEQPEKESSEDDEAAALIVNIDRGHVKTIEAQISAESLTSVVYSPVALVPDKKGTPKYLSNKKLCGVTT